jgi:hypothetical protein
MAGMLLKGGASALVGTGAAAQPPLTAAPGAATTAQSASGIAYGPQTAVRAPSNGGAMLHLGGHSAVWWGGVIGLAGMIWLYRSLPK